MNSLSSMLLCNALKNHGSMGYFPCLVQAPFWKYGLSFASFCFWQFHLDFKTKEEAGNNIKS